MTDLASLATARTPHPGVDRRDPRIDLLRGLALMMIFVNHIPENSLTFLTPRPFGFSDAAEVFVFLAGYASWMTYPEVVARQGWAMALHKIGRRIVVLWGTHAMLICGSIALVLIRYRITGRLADEFRPLLESGMTGSIQILTLQTLPAYLDILPLYMVLLAGLPLLILGLNRSVGVTLATSLVLYSFALMRGWNLPNHLDAGQPALAWTFDPFAWQLIFVLGAAASLGRRRGIRWLLAPPPTLIMACCTVLVFGILAADGLNRWPGLATALFPAWARDDGWKTVAAPWRVIHALAALTLFLGSPLLRRVPSSSLGAAVGACGRHSLAVFSAGCLLALLGRFAYGDFGISPGVQLSVNGVGIALQLALAAWLERRRLSRRATSLPLVSAQERPA